MEHIPIDENPRMAPILPLLTDMITAAATEKINLIMAIDTGDKGGYFFSNIQTPFLELGARIINAKKLSEVLFNVGKIVADLELQQEDSRGAVGMANAILMEYDKGEHEPEHGDIGEDNS